LLYSVPRDEITWSEEILNKVRRTRGSYARTDPDYVIKVDRRNRQIYMHFKGNPQRAAEIMQNMPPEERRALRRAIKEWKEFIQATPETLASRRPPETLNAELRTLNREIAEYFTKHPERLHELTPRKFEELIAAILRAMGCDVQLTKQTRDGGRDILAAFRTHVGELLTIVECKKYRANRPVGLGLVERFLYTIGRDKASCGLMVTTSYFSPDVQALARENRFRLKTRDFTGIHAWVSSYGQWLRDGKSELWKPDH